MYLHLKQYLDQSGDKTNDQSDLMLVPALEFNRVLIDENIPNTIYWNAPLRRLEVMVNLLIIAMSK